MDRGAGYSPWGHKESYMTEVTYHSNGLTSVFHLRLKLKTARLLSK